MKIIRLATFAFLGLTTAILPAAAQQWPNRPVRMLTAGGGGSGSDILGRIFSDYFQRQTGQSWIMDNRPGASGTVAGIAAKQSQPDGYTFYLTTVAGQAIAPYTVANLAYDPVKDFESVALLVQQPNILFVRADDDRFKSLKDLISYAKANPGKLNYGVSAIGTTTNMTVAQLKKQLGLDMVVVPYKSSGDTALAVLRKETELSVENIQVVVGQLGQVRPLAVSSKIRSPRLPDLPTFAEQGVDIDIASWFGVIAPKDTPKPIVDRMTALIKEAMNDPDVQKRLEQLGATPTYMDPAQFKSFQEAEVKKWGPIVEAAGVPKQ